MPSVAFGRARHCDRKGKANARELMALVDVDERIPESARRALSILVDQIEDLEVKIESSRR